MFTTIERAAPVEAPEVYQAEPTEDPSGLPEDLPADLPEDLLARMDAAHARAGAAHRELLDLLTCLEGIEDWEALGARDAAHWVSMRYGVSGWKARRWIEAAGTLASLPLTAEALAQGRLSLDQATELTRLATPATETDLVEWAQDSSPARIREEADLARRVSQEEAAQAERGRRLTWWPVEPDLLGIYAELPAAQGAVVVKAIERMTERVPLMPDEGERWNVEARRADALVAICSQSVAADPDPDRASLIVHVRTGEPGASANGRTEAGTVVPGAALDRLACDARLQTVTEDGKGQVLQLGRMRREPPAWMVRQLRHRDRGCVFPGCGTKAFTQAHHIVWWSRGGKTELENLVLVCTFHHRLVHEHGWSITSDREGEVRWFRRDGRVYLAGPSPPRRE